MRGYNKAMFIHLLASVYSLGFNPPINKEAQKLNNLYPCENKDRTYKRKKKENLRRKKRLEKLESKKEISRIYYGLDNEDKI